MIARTMPLNTDTITFRNCAPTGRGAAPSTWGGAWRGGPGRVGGWHDTHSQVTLRRLPLSGRGHQPRRVALLPLPPEPAHGRRDAGRPRHRGEPRDRAAVGAQVRPGLRQPDPAPAALSWRQMAPGRSVPDDRRPEALALAGGRSGWGCARRLGPEPARQEGRQALAPEAAEKAGPAPSCDDHGQTGELQCR